MSSDKNFKLKTEDIDQLIEPMGGCLATDKITVDGELVGYMVLLTLTVGTGSFGQKNSDSLNKINTDQLKLDFTVFRDSLQKLHPSLYRYQNKDVLNKMFDSCYATLNKQMTVIEFYKVISFIVSSIEDGHTSCFLPRETIRHMLSDKIFPLQLRFINNQAYIPCETKKFPAATEIISVDGEPIGKIKEKLFSYLPSDGKIQTEKYWEMNNGDNPFFILYYLIYGQKSSFNVGYKTKAGKIESMVVKADNFKNLECFPKPINIDKYLLLDYTQNNTAILTIKTFNEDFLKKSNEDFPDFISTSFKEINKKGIKTLIIDLRNNSGGQDAFGSLLYSYLTDRPFSYYASLESVSKKFTKDDHPNLAVQKPNENNFKKTVLFLINGKSFSTTAEFCSIAKSNKRGKFIGEETGGGYYGNTSGERTTIVLPNSQIKINIPLDEYVMAVQNAKYKDRGIIPEYIIIPTIDDIIQNKDVQLNAALKLAARK